MAFDARTLAWVAENFRYDLETKGWESPAQLWDHLLSCDTCDVFGELAYIEDNPQKPVYGPPIPRECWSPMDRMLHDAYMPAVRGVLEQTERGLSFTAAWVPVSQATLKGS